MVYDSIDSKVALVSDPLFPGNAVIDILRETGIGMEAISEGEDIFFKLKRGNIGLIIIDVVTINPKMLDLIERLQNYVQEMPVVVMSAESTYRQLKEHLRFKEFYYLNKPYQNDEFLILVRRLLSMWSLKSAALKTKERLQVRESELEVYTKLGRILSGNEAIDEKISNLLTHVKRVIPSEAVNLALVETVTGDLVFHHVRGRPRGENRPRFHSDHGVLGWTALHREPAIIANTKRDKRYDPAIEEITGLKVRSMLCMPIIYSGVLLGVMQLLNRTGNTQYTMSDAEVISPLTDYAALAIANWQLKSKNEEMSTTDPLTGLYNTKYLDTAMDQEIERGDRYRTPFCFMIIDIDNFYGLCEKLGREAGTELVRDMSKLLLSCVTPIDIVARYTADRFAALIPNVGSKDGLKIAHNLAKRVREERFLPAAELEDDVTISIGLASYPEDAEQKTDLMTLAHLSLDAAKKKGKDKTVTADEIELPPGLQDDVTDKQKAELKS